MHFKSTCTNVYLCKSLFRMEKIIITYNYLPADQTVNTTVFKGYTGMSEISWFFFT